MDLTFVGSQTHIVAVEDASQIGQVRREATQVATSCGFDEADTGRVALVATELATNVLKHAKSGEVHIAMVPGDGTLGVEVIAVDRGPGFNLADCLPDGFSTQGTRGEGLGAVMRQTQVMDMHADHRGAVVLARMYPKGFAKADIRFGATYQRLHGELVCGDAWGVALRDAQTCVIVLDGLGHGFAADEAARAGIDAWRTDPFDEATTLMATLDAAMGGTRGGAVAVSQFDASRNRLRFAGIGNISGSFQTAESSRGLASHPGIVGSQMRRVQAFDFDNAGGSLLIMHSDGLQSRWSLRDYPGLVNRHPAVVTAVLYRDFCRGRDDLTVVAIRLEAVR